MELLNGFWGNTPWKIATANPLMAGDSAQKTVAFIIKMVGRAPPYGTFVPFSRYFIFEFLLTV